MANNFLKVRNGINLAGQSTIPSNPVEGDLYFDTASSSIKTYANGVWVDQVKSNNYIKSPNNITGWATYSNTAQAAPVNGTGGTATGVTISNTTSNPLAPNSTQSILFAKDAANRQGKGMSYDFTIAPKDQASVLNITIPMVVDSGTFVAGASNLTPSDVTVWIYDVTNSVLIQPSSISFYSNSSTIPDTFNSTFQTSSNSTSYRLIFQIASTSASAYTLKFGGVTVWASNYIYGTPVTDWTSYTPTGSWITNTTYAGLWRRVGDAMEIQVKATTSGAPTATGLSFNIPSGYSIDTTKILSAQTNLQAIGYGAAEDVGSAYHELYAVYNSATSIAARYISNGTTSATAQVTNIGPYTFASGDSVNLTISVPIVGWSSSVQMADNYSGRSIAMSISGAGGTAQSVASGSPVKVTTALDTLELDTVSCWNNSLKKYVIPTSGTYIIYGSVYFNDTLAAGGRTCYIYKNGVNLAESFPIPGSTSSGKGCTSVAIAQLKAGDEIELYAIQNSGSPISIAFGPTRLSLTNISSGSSTLAANATVAFAINGSGQTGVNPNNSSVKLTWNGVAAQVDTTGSYSVANNRYNIPIAGLYQFSAFVLITPTNVLNSTYALELRVNGTVNQYLAWPAPPPAGNSFAMSGNSTPVNLKAGDYVEIYLNGTGNNSSNTLSLSGSNQFSGRKI